MTALMAAQTATPVWLILLMLGLSVLSGLAPIFIKKGSRKLSTNLMEQIHNYNLWAGCALYAGTLLIFVPLLKYGELSVLYPVASTSYIWVCIFSVKILGEKMNKAKWAGICGIMAGVLLITLSAV